MITNLKSLLNQVVGKVRIDVPQTYRDQSYETAAWWQERVSSTGVFDVYLRQDPYNKRNLYLQASLPATIVRENFQSLFAGNAIGKAYDQTANAGLKCQDVSIRLDIVTGICGSCASDANQLGQKWVVYRELWPLFVRHFEDQLQSDYMDLPGKWASYANGPDDKYNSKVCMVAFIAERIAQSGRAVEKLKREVSREVYNVDYYVTNNPFLGSEVP